MTVDRSPSVPRREPLTVLVRPGHPAEGGLPELELRGTVDPGRVETVVRQVIEADEHGPSWRYRLRRHGSRHHTVTFAAAESAQVAGGVAALEFPAGLLADLLTAADTGESPRPDPRILRASPVQRELLADADARPGGSIGVAQLSWEWHGPLDPDRFAAAWQSVCDRESVLRAAFDDTAEPGIVVHQRVVPELLHLTHPPASWPELLAQDRDFGLDPRRPGPVRVTVVDHGGAAPYRMLFTYHHALVDDTSARLLVREFFHAYLAGGRLPGGERRPDIGDYGDWLAAQDLTPAQEFWSEAAPPPDATDFPAFASASGAVQSASAGDTGVTGDTGDTGDTGRGAGVARRQRRLSAEEASALSAWAARWGATDFGALQAAWALLLHRSTGTGTGAAAPVAFSVAVSGRGVPLDSVDRMPGALRNVLPMSVAVDPRTPVPRLLAQLRDRALDMAAYEWVSAGQIGAWTNQRGRAPGTLLEFKGGPRPFVVPGEELAAQGIRVSEPVTHGADTVFPLALTAHYDEKGGLVLTMAHDPSRLPDTDRVLSGVVRLLRQLPYQGDQYTTAAAFLDSVDAENFVPTGLPVSLESSVPVVSPVSPVSRGGVEGAEGVAEPVLRMLRPAAVSPETPASSAADAAVVCLVPAPGASAARHERLARFYPGPEALVLLSGAPRPVEARLDALAPLLGPGRRLVLGAFSGGGAVAYELAGRVLRAGGGAPLVVLAAATTSADAFARVLADAAAPAGQ